jgi:hypothetical protein
MPIASATSADADRLGDHREHRHAEHERGEEQVHLGGDPDRHPGTAQRRGEVAVHAHLDGVGRRFLREQQQIHACSSCFMKNGIFFEKSTGIARRTSAMTSRSTRA